MSYKQVSDALKAGSNPETLCASCPWDRNCVNPPSMTPDEVAAEIEQAKREDELTMRQAAARGESTSPVSTLLAITLLSGRDSSLPVCPVLAMRLRQGAGRGIAERIKADMQAGAL